MFISSKKKTLRKVAVDWFVRMQDMGIEDSERSAFEAWLMSSQLHQEAYAEVAGMWGKLDSTSQLERLNSALQKKKALEQSGKRKLATSALSLLLIIGVGIFGFRTWQSQPVMQMTASANVGEVISQTLEDGSKLVINANSDIDITYFRNKRVINLNRGEAIFEVTKDENRPFIVVTDTTEVTVLGTRFAVNKLRNNVRVSVDHGRVKIQAKNSGSSSALGEPIIITDGQVAEVLLGQPTKYVNRLAADAFTFQHGIITFTDADIYEICETLSRYRHQPVYVEAGEKFNTRITAVVKSRNVERFISNLPSLAPVKLIQLKEQLLIVGASKNN